jgi:hypothetical protein
MARERKKAKTAHYEDVYDIFLRLSVAYEELGDKARQEAFASAGFAIAIYYQKLDTVLITSGADIAKIKGCGKASVEVVDEFIKTGRCTRLEELEGDETHLGYEEIIKKRIEKRTKELEAMDAPKDVEDAKAFILIGHKYCKSRTKEAKAILKSMDDSLKVILADMLKKEGYAVDERWRACRCDSCDNYHHEVVRHGEGCLCEELELESDAVAIGCVDLPSIGEDPFEE